MATTLVAHSNFTEAEHLHQRLGDLVFITDQPLVALEWLLSRETRHFDRVLVDTRLPQAERLIQVAWGQRRGASVTEANGMVAICPAEPDAACCPINPGTGCPIQPSP